MLAQTPKFSITGMQCAQDNQEDFIWVVMWVSAFGEKSGQLKFGNMELLRQETREQPPKHQVTNKFTNTPNFKIQ